MKKRLLLSFGALGAGVLLSGCASWFFAGSTLTDVRLKPDEKTVLTTITHPMLTEDFRSYPFFLIATPDDGSINVVNPRRFDVKETFTRRGLPLFSNNALRDHILAEFDECGTIPTDDANTTYRVFVTDRRVNDQGKPQLKAVSKIGLKQVALADSTFSQVGVAVGSADPNNDGNLSDSLCTGGAAHAVFTKVDPNAPREDQARLRSLNRALSD